MRHLRIRQAHTPNCWEEFFESVGRCVDPHGGEHASPSLRQLEIISNTVDTSILGVLEILALQNVEEISVILTPHHFLNVQRSDTYAREVLKFFGELFEILTVDATSPESCLPNVKCLHTELSREHDEFVEAEMLGLLFANMIGSRRRTPPVTASTSSSSGSISLLQKVSLRFKRSRFLKPFLSDEAREGLRGL